MPNGGDAEPKPEPGSESGPAERGQRGESTPSGPPPSGGVPHAASHLSGNPPPAEPEEDSDAESGPPSIPSAASLKEGSILSVSIQELAPVTAPSAVLPGHVLADRYEVVSVLGEGGMGIVYRCIDLATGSEVALKRVIPPESKLAAEYIMWFYKEARALAALDHPSIVRARDFGQLRDGTPYLSMDLVTGVSLHDLSQVANRFELIWHVIDQVLGALAHAHA